MVRIVAIIQARTGATRLPNKVMSDICRKTMLERVVTRVQRSKVIATVVATTRNPMDDVIYQMCQYKGWTVFRGDEEDVLDRFYWASIVYDADVIVRVSADCPLIDPEVIDYCIAWFLDRKVDYASNKIPHSYPLGLDVEVVKFPALKRAFEEDKNYREHVTPYIYKNPGKFTLLPVMNTEDLSGMRWTVDTQEDLEFIRKIYSHFRRDDFNWREVVELLRKHPEWAEINKYIKQVIV